MPLPLDVFGWICNSGHVEHETYANSMSSQIITFESISHVIGNGKTISDNACSHSSSSMFAFIFFRNRYFRFLQYDRNRQMDRISNSRG